MWAIKCICRLLRAQSTSHRNSTVTFSLRLYSTLFYDRFIYRINMNPVNLFLQVLGTPTREQIREMNPNYTEFKFPQIKAHPWTKVGVQYIIVEVL